jgi:hypothetical protein
MVAIPQVAVIKVSKEGADTSRGTIEAIRKGELLSLAEF